MKKKYFLIGLLVLSLFFLASCKRTYYATVTVFNDGEILITVTVDDDPALIDPGEGVEWTLSWEGSRTIQVYLYAEPVGYNDYDDEWATLSDGEDYTWSTGWNYAKGSGLQKKKSR